MNQVKRLFLIIQSSMTRYYKQKVRIRMSQRFNLPYPPTQSQAPGVNTGNMYNAPVIPREMRKIVNASQLSKNELFIDLGCGDGYALALANTFGFKRAIGIDLDRSCLEEARSLSGSFDSLHLQQIDIVKFRLPSETCVLFMYNSISWELMDKFLQLNADTLKVQSCKLLLVNDHLGSLPGRYGARLLWSSTPSKYCPIIFDRKSVWYW